MGLNFESAVIVSLNAIGVFFTMLFFGYLLRKLGKFPDTLSKGLAQISVNVAIPALLFTNMINCNQDYSTNSCPNLADSLHNGWPLFLWPLAVVGMGLVLARCIVLPLGRVPLSFRKTAAVAVAFGNSTGLPITLLTAIHRSYNPTTEPLGMVDPTLYLAVYLLLYPLLQWTLGGYLIGMYNPPHPAAAAVLAEGRAGIQGGALSGVSGFALQEPNTEEDDAMLIPPATEPPSSSLSSSFHDGPASNEHVAPMQLETILSPGLAAQRPVFSFLSPTRTSSSSLAGSVVTSPTTLTSEQHAHPPQQRQRHLQRKEHHLDTIDLNEPTDDSDKALLVRDASSPSHVGVRVPEALPLPEPALTSTSPYTLLRQQVLQPPTIAILAGILVGLTPIRSLFLDTYNRDNDAPLEWIFNGMANVGAAAIPINMFIMGASLAKGVVWREIPWRTNLLIALCKLVVMPLFGFLCAFGLSKTFPIDNTHAPAFFLVMILVTCTPTANNIMVMTELAGENKTMLSACMFIQYLLTPLLLTPAVILAVALATSVEHN